MSSTALVPAGIGTFWYHVRSAHTMTYWADWPDGRRPGPYVVYYCPATGDFGSVDLSFHYRPRPSLFLYGGRCVDYLPVAAIVAKSVGWSVLYPSTSHDEEE